MKTTDTAPRLFEISVKLNTSVLTRYLTSSGGLLADAVPIAAMAILILGATALQLLIPGYFPGLPLFPAVIVIAWAGTAFSPRKAFFWAVAAGILLDAATFSRPGCTSLIFTAAALTAGLTAHWLRSLPYPVRTAVTGGCSVFTWLLLRLVSSALPGDCWAHILLQYVLGGTVLSALCCAPLLFPLLDLTSDLLKQLKNNA